MALCETSPPPPPPTPPLVLDRASKLQLGILLFTNFLVQLGVGMIIVTLPLYAEAIGLGATGVGLLIALPQLTKLLMNLPIGHLVDVVGRKPALVAGSIIDSMGQFATGLATSIGSLVPARLLVGVGSATGSVTGPATLAYQMDVVGKFPEHSGQLLGTIQAMGFLAFAIGPACGGIICERVGPAAPILLLGAFQAMTVPLKMLLPETLPPERRVGGGAKGLRDAMGGQWASYRTLLADQKQLALLAMKSAFLCGLSLILTVVPLHATASWGASATDLGQLTSAVTFLALFGSLLAGKLADSIGRPTLAIAGSLATTLAVACMPFATSALPYFLLRSIWSTGEAFLITAYSALALDITPEQQRGARNSLDNQVGDVALLFLPLIIGATGQLISHSAAFWLASGLMLLFNLLFARLLKL